MRTNDKDNLLSIDKPLLCLCTDGIIPENTNYMGGYLGSPPGAQPASMGWQSHVASCCLD